MGAAAHVGRVGGLAVALGVGSAVFLGHGVASADDAESATSKPSVSATSTTDATDTSSVAEKPAKSAEEPTPDDESDEAEQEAEPKADAEPDEDADEDAEPAPEPDADTEDPDDDSTKAPAKSRGTTPRTSVPTPVETEAAPADDDSGTADSGTTISSGSGTAPDAPPAAAEQPETAADDEEVTTPAGGTSATAPAPTVTTVLAEQQKPEAAAIKPNLITAVVNVVTSMIDWAQQRADADPGDAPQPPFLWALMAFARRELDTLFAARATTNGARSTVVTPTSLALAEGATTAALSPSYSPWLNPQVSPSTNFVSWVTGPRVYWDNPLLANTLGRYQVYGTDVGVMWDNGMVDNPATDWNEHQVLIAVGDTFGAKGMTGRWIYNTLFRSSDTDLSDGMDIPDGEWKNGNMFGGAPLSDVNQARPIINRPIWAPNSVTLIPTAGISLPTAVTKDTPFGTIQYVNFMSVSKWGQSGRWTTNYSATAYSTDNGENFKVAPESVRYNSFLSGNRNFQQSAYVKGDDGYVYVYGTPNGRQGAAYLARVANDDILDVSKYEYYKKASSGWFGSTPARWVQGSPSSASAIIGKTGGLFGFTKPGYTVSELSVQYNAYLKKYIVLYGDQSNNIVMRTADTPEGTWSDAKVLMTQQTGGIYAPMLHPWSPATEGTGSDLYWNLSLWSEYNVMLMHTDLTKI